MIQEVKKKKIEYSTDFCSIFCELYVCGQEWTCVDSGASMLYTIDVLYAKL